MTGIIGKKIKMTQIFHDGVAIPVTIIQGGPCKIVGMKNKENAISLSFGKKSPSKTSKAMKTIFAKAGGENAAVVRDFKVDNLSDYSIGNDILVDVLEGSEYVDVTGTSKGRGFQGVVKRYGFAGGPASHGSSKFHRRPGSIGNKVAHGRVYPGKKLPGHYGDARVTVQNLKVVKIDKDNNLLVVKGAIPGANNGYLMIKPAIKKGGKK